MGGADGQEPSLLDASALRQFIRQLEKTDVDELDLQVGSSRLCIRREPGQRTSELGSPALEAASGVPVCAPLTGVYYSRASPDQPAYATAGDEVHAGQVLALIETMKLFNEVIAEVGGEVDRVLVEDGDLVEVGQALMYIRQSRG